MTLGEAAALITAALEVPKAIARRFARDRAVIVVRAQLADERGAADRIVILNKGPAEARNIDVTWHGVRFQRSEDK